MKGTVRDTQGNTLPQANVYVSDAAGNILTPAVGTQSDLEGRFTMAISSGYLTASYVGYEKQTLPVAPVLDFTLAEKTTQLSEFTVFGQPIDTGGSLSGILLGAGLLLLMRLFSNQQDQA